MLGKASSGTGSEVQAASPDDGDYKSTACILCNINCGLKVKTDNGHIVKIIGDKAHPASQGYVCEKTQRLDYYQNSPDRLQSPMRRRPDGSYEAIDWETAIREVADKFTAVRDKHGGERILYYGGGGQGNHLCGGYANSWLKALGVRFRSSALAQEKTGEFWVAGQMMGVLGHGDFEHSQVTMMIGKNPWQSHGFARARAVIREIEKDPQRSLVVIDPRRTETADKADYHLALKPGTDAWCLGALVAILVQEDLVNHDWMNAHTEGYNTIRDVFSKVPVPEFARYCGVHEETLRDVARLIAGAESFSAFEDLGMQMSIHSTLGSWLQRLLWLSTGHFAREGCYSPFVSLAPLVRVNATQRTSPVLGARTICGLIPCNIMAEEILADHPDAYRAMIIDSGNPVHSVADSQLMREAMRSLDVSVVIDIAMTETAREADYVLPACSQFEKVEATFFNLEAPVNSFHLRHPIFEPLPGSLPEAEIHARLLEAMGELKADHYTAMREAAEHGLQAFGEAFFTAAANDPTVMKYVSVLLYRTLGPALPAGMEQAAAVWGLCLMYVQKNPTAAARVGFEGDTLQAANALFAEMLSNPSGVEFGEISQEEMWQSVERPDHRIRLDVPEMLEKWAQLDNVPRRETDYPMILSAGERRSETTNTIVRSDRWHRKGAYAALAMCAEDAEALGCGDGDAVRLVTPKASGVVTLSVSDRMQTGHISLPNGMGLDTLDNNGELKRRGLAPNEFTDSGWRDPIAGTPWHKHVPARVERIEGA
ncbi:MAG: molybdopterin-dependent oxidoreductase [Pseudomonadota bacterium]